MVKTQRTEKTIFNRKIKLGKYSEEDGIVYVEVEVKDIDLSTEKIYNREGKLLRTGNTKLTTNLKKVSKYRTLSISGYCKTFAGQIQDELNPKYFERLDVSAKALNKLVVIWRLWHLNDLNAGSNLQTEALEELGGVNANEYTKQCEFLESKNLLVDRGYKFGSAWLIKDLPTEAYEELTSTIAEMRN